MSLSQELHDAWLNPPSTFRGAPFWSWNARLAPGRLTAEIQSMHGAGLGGFFMHSRYGLKTPYLSPEWFACISACVEKARQLGMKAYLYDEDRWPSGAAGGIVTRKNPAYGTHLLDMVALRGPGAAAKPAGDGFPFTARNADEKAPPPHERLGVFAVEVDDAGRLKSYAAVEEDAAPPAGQALYAFDLMQPPVRGWYNDGRYLDTLNPEAVAEFIHVTHQAYADRYGKDFGELIPAIFTDEPNHGHITFPVTGVRSIPWTGELVREFKKRRGYDIRDHLPELFHDSAGEAFSKVRHDYFRTVTALFVKSFSAQIGQWCEKHRIALTGHMLREETLYSQIVAIGAAMPHYEHFQWPGIDILTDQAQELTTAKQCSSVADQLGKPRVLSELYGCTGWDWPLEGHKFIGDWQFAAGVNFRCPHLTHYSLAGGAKRDYPASIYEHSPWWPYYREVEDYFGRLSLMLTQGRPVRDVLVIHPIESAWGVFGPGSNEQGSRLWKMNEAMREVVFTLSGQHYDWDYGDETVLGRHGKVGPKGLKVGQMSYQVVVVPPLITLRAKTVELLGKFLSAGGKVLFVGEAPTHVDGQPSDAAKELVAKAAACGGEAAQFMPALEAILPRRLSIAEEGSEASFTWAMLRQVKGGQILFLQSHDRKAPHRVTVTVRGQRPVVLWDLRSGARRRVKARQDGDRAEFDLDLEATGSALLSLGVTVPEVAKVHSEAVVAEAAEVRGPFDVELTEPNTLPLDYCTYQFGTDAESALMPTLQADAEIRKRFGLLDRLGYQQQPWYLYATGVVDTAPRGHCVMRRRFHVTALPKKCLLALEQPENFRVLVNGKQAAYRGGANRAAGAAPDAGAVRGEGVSPLRPAGAARGEGVSPLRPAGVSPAVVASSSSSSSETAYTQGYWVDLDIKTIDIASLLQAGDNELVLDFDYRPDMELEDLYLVGDFGVARRHCANGDLCPPEPGHYTLVEPPRTLKLGSWVGQGLDFYGAAVRYKLRADKPAMGRCRIALPEAACTAAAVHVNGMCFPLPWAPFAADITDAMTDGGNDVVVEIIGGRKNILGPLHTPWVNWTGPGHFNPENKDWTKQYLLVDHGLMAPVQVETMEG